MKISPNSFITFLFNTAHYFRKLYWRTFKIKTFGVRVILVKDNKVLLVKHRYGNLWVFPGGGCKKGESVYEVAERETLEEVNIYIKSFRGVLGVYKNTKEGKNDTVTILVAKDFEIGKLKKNFEIKDSGWFSVHNLPETISGATRRRITELASFKEGDFLIESAW